MTSAAVAAERDGAGRALFALLLVDTVLLATIELFFLPLRFSGAILPALGSAPFPVTVLLALVTTPLLVRTSARLVRPRLAALPLLLWLATLVVLGVLGPGGDRVLVADWRTLLLLLCGALPAAALLGRILAAANAGAGSGTQLQNRKAAKP